MTYKNDLAGLTVRGLRARRRRLASGLSDVEALLRGTVVTQGRRCGKETCRCASGQLHGPYTYLSVPRPGRRPRLVYVPAELAQTVSGQVAVAAVLVNMVESALVGGLPGAGDEPGYRYDEPADQRCGGVAEDRPPSSGAGGGGVCPPIEHGAGPRARRVDRQAVRAGRAGRGVGLGPSGRGCDRRRP